MSRCLLFLPLAACAALALTGPARAAEANGGLTDEQVLRTAGLSADGPALLQFFRTRTQTEVEPDQLAGLVAKLGSKTAEERDKVIGELVALGPLAVPLLRQAARDPDVPEQTAAARRCLEFIEGDPGVSLPAVAARVVAAKKPEGAAAVLLDYLPFATDETVLAEIKGTLASLAVTDGKLDDEFLKRLEDKSSLKRAVVAEVLARTGGEEVRPLVRKLLQDPKPVVRLRVALALAERKDPDAVASLIDLLSTLPTVLGKHAEEHLVNLAGDQAPKVQLGDTDASRKQCRDAWATWWKASEGDGALREFRKRTLTEADREKVQRLIRQLGDDAFDVRERAQAALTEYGSSIAPLLRMAQANEDEEVKKRAVKILEVIDKESKSSSVLPVQARLVALRKPEGAAEVLLAFLPFADEDNVQDEVRAALAAVAVRGGKVEPAIVKALEDKLPIRRSAAAEALAPLPEQRPAVRKLLQDTDPLVRLRVALALAGAREKEAVPVLIDLLGELPSEKGTQAEVFLRTIAGERAPNVYLGADDESRKKTKEAWQAWWKVHGATVDLGRPATTPRMLGYTLIVSSDFNRISEIGLDGKMRWQIDNLGYPRDAQALPGDRVLIAEQNFNRVVEMNQKREILWSKQLNGPPVACQRLPNGNTFIAMQNGIIEVDRSGKEVFQHMRNQYDIMTAARGPDGQIVFLTNAAQVVRLSAAGKELKSFHVGQAHWNTSLELLSNGRILMPMPNQSKVVEYDADGKIVWEAAVQYPFSAQRLPNGNTVVASYNQMKILELNRAGRVVWEHRTSPQDRPYRARRR